ncbi:MAG: EAL domain-containing protein [Sideroxydans sp.]|nr:EAL domain-containing protein [Sideroxydans sp.]
MTTTCPAFCRVAARSLNILGICALLLAIPAHAAPALPINPSIPSYSLAGHTDVLEDKSGQLTIEEVSDAAHSNAFHPAMPAAAAAQGDEINFGYSASAYWLRLAVNAPAPQDMLLEVGFPSLDHVSFYAGADGGWRQVDAGDLLPFDARPVYHRNFVFPVHLLSGSQTLYLRVQSAGTVTVPLHLWQPEAFHRSNLVSYAALLLYFGMLLALLLYNLLLYFSLRDRNYLIYVCFVGSLAVALLALSGLGNQFVWPEWTAWGNVALPIGFASAGLFGTVFTRGFLHTRQGAPRHDRILLVLGVLFGFTILVCLTLPYRWAAISVSLLGALTPIVVVSSGIICLRQKQPGAFYFLLAWTLLMLGVSLMAARNMGWVPSNLLTLYGIQIGSALEMLLLSFALADRIHVLRREKEQAQANALAASQLAERELEDRVAERTEALSQANAQLRQSGLQLELLATNASDIIARLDADKRYLYVSAACRTILGYAPEELLGHSCEEFLHPDELNTSRNAYRQIADGAESATIRIHVRHHDGHYLWLESRLRALRDEAGNPTETIAVIRDISDRKRGEQRERIHNIALEKLAQGAPLYEVLETIVHGVEQERPGILCSILLLDQQGEHLLTGAAPSLPAFYNQAIHGARIGAGVGSCGNAAYTGSRTIVEDIQNHPYWAPFRELAARAELAACWSEPIRSSSGEILGTFAIYQQQPGGPSDADIDMIQTTCNLASIAIERKRTDELMWAHANYDPLTKLPNRRLFRDRLQQELKKSQRAELALALFFIDLDLFKEVNDTLGHDIGDMLLAEVASRIRGAVRDSDTVARISGDEFTVVLPELAETSRAEHVAQDILQTLAQPFQIEKEHIYISASIGITLYPADTSEIEELLKNADQAMYAAKKRGRNCFSYFTSQMQETVQHRMRLIKDMREALAGNQFQLYFQPIVQQGSGQIVKAEALIRWFHPERGLISPAQFIPLAEEVGLINDIGSWVFKEATRWMRRWHEQQLSCTQISINKSPAQFTEDSSQRWVDHLHEIGLPAACIAVEITEGLLLDERPDVAANLLQFRDAGIQVAIDDFGTGYSSLSYLKKFHIDYLKIDQSFVRDLASDPNDLALSEAIIVMAHKLGLKVVAEGVETVEQRDILAAAECDYLQGYLYARPMPAEEFDAMLTNEKYLAERTAGRRR